jgi:hypothetical protein
MVRLTVVPVIPLAWSDATNTATLAISASVMSRRPWVLLASNCCHCSHVIPVALARGSNAFLIVRVSRRSWDTPRGWSRRKKSEKG